MIPNFKLAKEKLYRLDLVLDIIRKEVANNITKDIKFIDLGCKDGYLLDKAKELSLDVHGLDISDNIVKILNKQGFKVKKADLREKMPYEDNYFDIVSCQQVIEHLTDPEHLIKECYRVLKQDGLMILSTPNLASIGSRLRLLFGKYPLQLGPCKRWHFGHHYRLFTLPILKQVLERNGFSIEKVRGTEVYLNPNSWLKGLHSKWLGRAIPSLAQRVIIVCRKPT